MRSKLALFVSLTALTACFDFDEDLKQCQASGKCGGAGGGNTTDGGAGGGTAGSGGMAGGGTGGGTAGAAGGGNGGGSAGGGTGAAGGGAGGSGGSGGMAALNVLLPSPSAATPVVLGPVARGDTFTREFSVLNNGGPPVQLSLALDAVAVDAGFGAALNTCAPPLNDADTCQPRVTFTANRTVGSVTGQLFVDAGLQDGGAVVGFTKALQATIVERFDVADVSERDFMSGTVGASGPTRNVVISHAGNTVTTLTISTSTSDFTAGNECNTLAMLDGGTCTLSVRFTPQLPGLRKSASLFIVNPLTTKAVAIPLVGDAYAAADLRFDAGGSFGVVDAGSIATRPFALTNLGQQPATFSLSLSNSSFAFDAGTCSGSLDAGGSCAGLVLFRPTDAGTFAGELSANLADGGRSPLSVDGVGRATRQLRVTVMPAGGGTIAVNGGTPCATSCSVAIDETSSPPTANVVATPSPALHDHGTWLGDCAANTSGACTPSMNQDRNVTATFVRAREPLTYSVGPSDGGTLVPMPAGVSCGPQCSAYAANTNVTLTLTKRLNTVVGGWSTATCGTSTTCVTTVRSGGTTEAVTLRDVNLAFVSAQRFSATELINPDSLCGALATDAGLPGTFRAFVGDGGAVRPEFATSRGWLRVDGNPFIDTVSESLNPAGAKVYYPLNVDQYGVPASHDGTQAMTSVWTGLAVTGSPADCNAFRNNSNAVIGNSGDFRSGSASWADQGGATCDNRYRVYCLSVGANFALLPPAPPTDGRIVFSYALPSGGGALSWNQPDNHCANAALDAGLPGVFLAMAGQFNPIPRSPYDRAVGGNFLQNVPLVRTDGVVLYAAAFDLQNNQPPKAAFNVGPKKEYPPRFDFAWAWMASPGVGQPPTAAADTCNDFSSEVPQGWGSPMELAAPLMPMPRQCSFPGRMLCVQH